MSTPANQQHQRDTERVALDLWPDVGRALGLSRGATYAAARRGELPTLKVGRRIIVPRAAFDNFLKRAELAPTPEVA